MTRFFSNIILLSMVAVFSYGQQIKFDVKKINHQENYKVESVGFDFSKLNKYLNYSLKSSNELNQLFGNDTIYVKANYLDGEASFLEVFIFTDNIPITKFESSQNGNSIYDNKTNIIVDLLSDYRDLLPTEIANDFNRILFNVDSYYLFPSGKEIHFEYFGLKNHNHKYDINLFTKNIFYLRDINKNIYCKVNFQNLTNRTTLIFDNNFVDYLQN